MTNTGTNIGENIRNARTAAGKTQRELADDLYVVQQAVYKWENGMSCP
ncbi:MAG: helix-turn-helix transcriptional regulator [Flexilinea sp.]|nr:helix-turn-helix transcriptional regulator [Flexilinea sp.]